MIAYQIYEISVKHRGVINLVLRNIRLYNYSILTRHQCVI